MPTIVWFNVPAGDTGRARAFYEQVFAWAVKPFPGMEQEGYLEIATEGIGGEILPRAHPGEPITVFIGVPSIDEYVARVQEAGGRVVIQKRAVPGRGYFAICEDTEQNRLGLWKDDPTAG
ncbi:VOC family protein [Methanoculleus sp.]|uniref:VOC family protein n=1 Tax=Methanoculleus sp. TaxID=90427 RepID=UPI0025D7BC6E|nr:VOC family protein [Methanoculleus sp.]